MKKLYLVLMICLFASGLIAQNFEEITGTPFNGVWGSSVAFADVDNDGDQDVLITGKGSSGPYISKLYLNDGFSNFEEVLDTPFVRVAFGSIAFADIDNDGDQDVLITGMINRTLARSKLYTNDGIGNFTEVTDTPFQKVGSSSIAFADIDNDGDQDVLITGNYGYELIAKLYTNDGNGHFIEVFDTPFEGVGNSSIAFADIDGDDDQDVLITGGYWLSDEDNISKLYRNNGFGNFTEVLDTPFDEVMYSSIAFTDIDNDGDQDVLITGAKGNDPNYNPISKLYVNDGNGYFEEVLNTPFEGVYRSSIAFADIDNDNDQDVIITGMSDSVGRISKLYTNDGAGSFSEVIGTSFEGVFNSSIAFADIDNDGDQDVLITGAKGNYPNYNPSSKLYRNLTIQVGINENTLHSSVSIYPNPNTGLVNIDLGSLNDVVLKVLNLSGQLIYYKENINTPIYQFELDATPGIYILELSAEGEKQQFKLVKN